MKFLVILLLFGWFSNRPDNSVIYIQPCNNFKNTERVVKELEKVIDAKFIILPDKRLDNSLLNDYKTRYRADRIIRSIHNKYLTIVLLHNDISLPYRNRPDWGVLGLSLIPGRTCVASDYRLKNKRRDFWKVVYHEYIHTRYNYKHCPKDNPECIMRDAKGKAYFGNKHGLCNYCKKILKPE